MDFKLKIITPNGIYLEEDVTRIDLKTLSGNIGVMARHLPIVSGLEIAPMTIIKGEKKDFYALHGGILNVSKDETIIITDAIEHKSDIDKKRAEIAKTNINKKISSLPNADKSLEISLKKAIIRLKI